MDGSQSGSQAREHQRTVTDSADETEPVTGTGGRPRTPADEPPKISYPRVTHFAIQSRRTSRMLAQTAGFLRVQFKCRQRIFG